MVKPAAHKVNPTKTYPVKVSPYRKLASDSPFRCPEDEACAPSDGDEDVARGRDVPNDDETPSNTSATSFPETGTAGACEGKNTHEPSVPTSGLAFPTHFLWSNASPRLNPTTLLASGQAECISVEGRDHAPLHLSQRCRGRLLYTMCESNSMFTNSVSYSGSDTRHISSTLQLNGHARW